MRGVVKFILFLIIFIIVVAVALTGVGFYLNQPSSSIPIQGTVFKVPKGETLSGISQRLKADGLIRSSTLLQLLSRLNGTEGSFQAGFYTIQPQMTSSDIHALIVSGQQSLIKVTIPEGWTVQKIANLLESQGVTSSEEFVIQANSAKMLNLKLPVFNIE